MTHPFLGKGGTRQQLADLCQRRITEIDGRQRELLDELRRLGAERTDLQAALIAVGIETVAVPAPGASDPSSPALQLARG